MKNIPIGNLYKALVDDEDYDDLIQFKWQYIAGPRSRTVYAIRRWWQDGKYKGEYMHKRITGFERTDHINNNGLDNRKENLRPSNRTQNKANAPKYRGNFTSQYKGVHWDKKVNKWRVKIYVNRRAVNLGWYLDEKTAAYAYDIAAVDYFGEFAQLNFPGS